MANIPNKIGQSGLDLIKMFEGLRLEKYQDVVGKWTIGYGYLIMPEERYLDKITHYEADDLLLKDLNRFEHDISTIVTVDINQNQFDVLVSLSFNIGTGNVRKSTLLKYLNQGNYELAANEFSKWNNAGGREIPGLTYRRKMEKELFLKA
ncbi:MAG: lysozyme [Symbiopectobacterium sp.]|uniref:lysozyme n=1 Tax=Symbiopectobacterium sp. TaxID=2952789 RepID=UPI0039ED0E69